MTWPRARIADRTALTCLAHLSRPQVSPCVRHAHMPCQYQWSSSASAELTTPQALPSFSEAPCV
ncbi:uncharacterized protein CC84DRAFT_534037 [Paraphaeosphaeria sporulosa]|uniref:Uncharacterized protein n=1 Tax=Paraphaeosphaeria sporulosa TaxID=1460663 RepID=A0A177CKK7_9PLEO|nr:uncharacterized protein CC84DRAFT_534037 [Paraphaeosphaeria sporulosa]OAG08033.1 hypothetical protein CC84DRAFT_534037 [Paraphaeosphaeria sporulosa]